MKTALTILEIDIETSLELTIEYVYDLTLQFHIANMCS